MNRRLDVRALISIVGEEKLREELLSTVYVFLHLRSNGVAYLYHYTVPREVNPIEYLVYNNAYSVACIVKYLLQPPQFYPSHVDYTDAINKVLQPFADKDLTQYTPFDANYEHEIALEMLSEAEDVPTELADLVWGIIGAMDKYDFKLLLDRPNETVDLRKLDGDQYLEYDRDMLIRDL